MVEASYSSPVPWYRRRIRPAVAAGVLTGLLAIIGVFYAKAAMRAQRITGGGEGITEPRQLLISFDLDTCQIPRGEILAGGPPKDGIPALTDPDMRSSAEVNWLKPDDRVIGIARDGEARAYPLRILNWHEAVNDRIAGLPVIVTYCPLCDSALVFDRRAGGEVREFGVSGLLYNSNVLLYDRQPDSDQESLWSQIMMEAVCGPAAGTQLTLLASSLTTWEDWSNRYPETLVVSQETGYERDYGRSPYTAYFESPGLMFPVSQSEHSSKHENKEQVLVIAVGDERRVLPFSRLGDGPVKGRVGGRELLVERTANGNVHVTPADGGEDPATAWMFWFVWAAMYPEGLEFGTDSRLEPE